MWFDVHLLPDMILLIFAIIQIILKGARMKQNKISKIQIIILLTQILLGGTVIIIGVLFLQRKLVNNVWELIMFVMSLICAILSFINASIISKKIKN